MDRLGGQLLERGAEIGDIGAQFRQVVLNGSEFAFNIM